MLVWSLSGGGVLFFNFLSMTFSSKNLLSLSWSKVETISPNSLTMMLKSPSSLCALGFCSFFFFAMRRSVLTKGTIFLVLLFLLRQALAQSPIDSLYVGSYRHLFVPSVGWLSRGQEITARHRKFGQINFRADNQNSLRFGATYKGLGLHIAYAPDILNQGSISKSSLFSLRANSFGRKISVLFHLLSTKGFYLSNPKSLLPNWNASQGFPQLPEMHTEEYKLTGFYAFNHKRFSFRHSNTFNEVQLKSAGSFVAGGSVRMLNAQTGSPALLDTLKPAFGYNQINSLDFNASGGYAYTFVFPRQYYVSLFLFTGPLVYVARTTSEGVIRSQMRGGWSSYGWVNIGQNKPRIFYGASLIFDRRVVILTQYDAETGLGTFWIFLGYRFGI